MFSTTDVTSVAHGTVTADIPGSKPTSDSNSFTAFNLCKINNLRYMEYFMKVS